MSIISLFNFECDKLLNGVDLFRKMLPSEDSAASVHHGEEGRFVENLVIEFLRKSLPSQLEVSTGFVVSSKDFNIRSGQVDILVYDKQRFVPIMKYGDAVVIHDQALVAAISVKKNIVRTQITEEFQALSKIGSMCGMNGNPKPYLALFAMNIRGRKIFLETVKDSFNKILIAFPERKNGWSGNEMVNDLIVLNKFIIKKKEWRGKGKEMEARYIMCGGSGVHRHLYVQHLVYGIGKVLNKMNGIETSVITDFPKIDFTEMGELKLCTSNRPYIPL